MTVYSDEGGVRIDVQCFETDTAGTELRDMTSYLVQEESRIERDTCASMGHATAHLVFIIPDDAEIPLWGQVRFAVHVKLTSLSTGETTGFQPRGVYLPETPQTMADQSPPMYQVNAHDVLSVIATSAGQSFSVRSGISVGAAIAKLLTLASTIQADPRLTMISDLVDGDRQWPIEDEQSFLVAIDQLLESAGWRSPWTDPMGVLTSEPWEDPATLAVAAHLEGNAIEMGATAKDDIWGVPNRLIFIRDVVGHTPTMGDGIYVVDNIVDGLASQSARGGRIVPATFRVDVVNHAALVAWGTKVAVSLFHVPDTVCFNTMPRLDVWHRDVVSIESPDLGYTDSDKLLVQKWALPFDGSLMQVVLNGIGVVAIPPPPPPMESPPGRVIGLMVSYVSGLTARVTWDPPTVGAAPIAYDVLRYGFVVASAISATSFDDTFAPIPGLYIPYTVRASNAHGTGPPASVTLGPMGTPPGIVRNLQASVVSVPSLRIRLTWDAPATGDTPFRYDVFRGIVPISDDLGTTVFVDVNPGTITRAYSVRAQNQTSPGPITSAIPADTAPGPVRNLSAAFSPVPSDRVNVDWDPPNTGGTVDDYRIERRVGLGAWTALDTDRIVSNYTDTAVTAGTTYGYRVRAQGPGGVGPYETTSAEIPDTEAPGPVRNLSSVFSPVPSDRVNVDWDAPNTGGEVTDYRIERRVGLGAWTALDTDRIVSSYTDTAVTAGTTYGYRVRAQGPGGVGPYETTSIEVI